MLKITGTRKEDKPNSERKIKWNIVDATMELLEKYSKESDYIFKELRCDPTHIGLDHALDAIKYVTATVVHKKDNPVVTINGQPVELEDVGGLSWVPAYVGADPGLPNIEALTYIGEYADVDYSPYDPMGMSANKTPTTCECGGSSVNAAHSTWCPLFEEFA